MDYSRVFDTYRFVPEQAIAYGFWKKADQYFLKKSLQEDGFYAVFCVTDTKLEINVYEEPDGELYMPFNVGAERGGFVNKIRAEVDELLEDVLKSGFALANIKAMLLSYVKETYGTIPEAPWGNLEEYHTLNTKKRHKWYGLFMLIPYQYLGIEKDGKIHVLNLKARPEVIRAMVDHIHYFPAYHMNKKYWMSVLLDKTADVEHIKRLLDESYAIVEGIQ